MLWTNVIFLAYLCSSLSLQVTSSFIQPVWYTYLVFRPRSILYRRIY